MAGRYQKRISLAVGMTLTAMSLIAGCATTGNLAAQVPPAGPGASTGPVASAPFTAPEASGSREATPSPELAQIPDRTVEENGGFKLTTLSSTSCTAEGPADWTIQAPERSDRADVVSPDGSMYAGYGIQAVNTALQAYAVAYDPPLNDPALYSEEPAVVAQAYGRIVVAALGGSPDLVLDDVIQATPDYVLLLVSGATHRGAIFFRASGFPGDGMNYSYALPMYFAFTSYDRWDGQGLLVARVAASIRCSTQFQPPDDYPIVEAADAGDAADENGDDAGYNPQLGTESVHDPETGENYVVDPSVNWSATGPDGPGYYVPKSGGNDYQKLEPGRAF